MELKNAKFPNHEHRHRHYGSRSYNFASQQVGYGSKKKGSRVQENTYVTTIQNIQRSVNVNFAFMNESAAPVTRIMGSNIEASTGSNELYPPHMRVTFIFKCY